MQPTLFFFSTKLVRGGYIGGFAGVLHNGPQFVQLKGPAEFVYLKGPAKFGELKGSAEFEN